jgi:sortase A
MLNRRFKAIGYILCISGLCLLISSAYPVVKAHLGTYLLSQTWEKVKEESKPQRPWPSADFSAVARLDVPALGTSRIVLDKSSGQAMTWGIGLVEASMTHSNSPIILAGHRDSHMSFMAHLSKGDELKIQLSDGFRETYIVNSIEVTDQPKLGLLPSNNNRQLLLTTCWPIHGVGPTDKRLVIRAERKERAKARDLTI